MDRQTAYLEVSRELNRLRSLEFTELLERVNQPDETRVIRLNGEEIHIETCVTLLQEPQAGVFVEVRALGGNWYANQQVRESFVRHASASSTGGAST